jgi:hypothetical protein
MSTDEALRFIDNALKANREVEVNLLAAKRELDGPEPEPPPNGEWEPTPGLTWSQRFVDMAAPDEVSFEASVPDTWTAFRYRAKVQFGPLVEGRHVFSLLLPGQPNAHPWPLSWEYGQGRSVHAVVGAHPAPTRAKTGQFNIEKQLIHIDARCESGVLVVTLTRPDGGVTSITDNSVIAAVGMGGGSHRFGATEQNQENQGYAATAGEVIEALLEVR